MIQRPPRSKHTYTPCPYTTLYRAGSCGDVETCNSHRHSASAVRLCSHPARAYSARTPARPATSPIHRWRHGQVGRAQRSGPGQTTTSEAATNEQSRRILRYAKFRGRFRPTVATRSEEHTSELQSLMRISYAVFCLKKKKK